jgi:hypothetical protein
VSTTSNERRSNKVGEAKEITLGYPRTDDGQTLIPLLA